jgi:hypothetical protein
VGSQDFAVDNFRDRDFFLGVILPTQKSLSNRPSAIIADVLHTLAISPNLCVMSV